MPWSDEPPTGIKVDASLSEVAYVAWGQHRPSERGFAHVHEPRQSTARWSRSSVGVTFSCVELIPRLGRVNREAQSKG